MKLSEREISSIDWLQKIFYVIGGRSVTVDISHSPSHPLDSRLPLSRVPHDNLAALRVVLFNAHGINVRGSFDSQTLVHFELLQRPSK